MKQDQIVRATFSIFDAAGAKVTGRAGTVTTNLQMDNAATGETVTVAESSAVPGDYEASFTPLATGTYRLDVYDATYNAQGWTGTWEVLGADNDSIAVDVAAVKAETALILTDTVLLLGLTGENTEWTGLTFDANHNLTGATITHYTDNTLVTPGTAWTVAATYDADSELLTYTMVKV
ncbi:hypothetical protein KKA53_05240 [Candidatus Dependentiae bacterium]|nr:hypothetical protein [Candidatus Dependentiae bacterium]